MLVDGQIIASRDTHAILGGWPRDNARNWLLIGLSRESREKI